MMRRSNIGESSVYGEENQRLEEDLKQKVSMLKDLSISIGDEVRDQNSMIGDMDDDMSKVKGFLGLTMNKLKSISKQGYGKLYCYLGLFCLGVFSVMYFLIRIG